MHSIRGSCGYGIYMSMPSKQHFEVRLNGSIVTVYAAYHLSKAEEWDGGGLCVEFDWITNADTGEFYDCHDSEISDLVADQIFYFNQ